MKDKINLKKVVGLQYDPHSMNAPEVLLKGVGPEAERVIAEARELADGPIIINDEELLGQLYQLPIDAEIGQDLYEVIAILLIHLYGIDKLMADSHTSRIDSQMKSGVTNE